MSPSVFKDSSVLRWLKIAALLLFAAGSVPLAAQDALDQTDPSQEAQRRFEPVRDELPVRIELQPVLETGENAIEQAAVDVGAIVIDGLIELARSDFAPILNDYMGRTLNREELGDLTDRLATLARERGYLFANASIPPQSLIAGTLRVRVDEGVIDKVRVMGSQDRAISRMLEPLVNGRPVTIAELERHVLLANDLPGVSVHSTRFEHEGDLGVLLVEAYRDDWSGQASIVTDGTRPVGPVRARIDLRADGLLLDAEGVELSFTATPFNPEELVFFSTRYSVVVNTHGTTLGTFGTYSETEPGAYLSDLQLSARSWSGGVSVRHPVIRRRSHGLWLEGSLQIQDLRQQRMGALARHDRISVARLGAFGFLNGPGGLLRSRLTISQGLGVFGATQLGDPLASRADAQPDFTTLDLWVGYQRQLGDGFSLALDATGQLSTTPLLIGEDFSLGGSYYLRGYDFSTLTGDKGIMGVGELRYEWSDALGLFRQMQVYAFADGGVVGNLAGGFGSGSLASGGGGFRADVNNRLDLDLEVAMPFTGPRYDTNDKSPRINFRLSQSF